MLLRELTLHKKIMVLLLTLTIGLALFLVSCVELPTPSPVTPTEPETQKETPVTPTQPPIKPEAVPSPTPSTPTPIPSPQPPPTEEKPSSNGLVEPQATSTTTNSGTNKIFLNIDGIAGESTDSKHDEWIDVISFNHGISQPALSTTTRTAERSAHQDFVVIKELDKSSPKLALACCNGSHITEVIIEVCQAETSDKYMRYTLTDVIVASISQNGSSQSENARPIEEISLRYGRIDWSYTEIDPLTSKAKGNVEAYWDVETNKGG